MIIQAPFAMPFITQARLHVTHSGTSFGNETHGGGGAIHFQSVSPFPPPLKRSGSS